MRKSHDKAITFVMGLVLLRFIVLFYSLPVLGVLYKHSLSNSFSLLRCDEKKKKSEFG